MRDTERSSRSPLVAAMLSLVCTGLGHLYCGRGAAGLGLFVASLLFGPAAFLIHAVGPSMGSLVALLAVAVGIILLYVAAAIDAAAAARKPLFGRDYQRDWIYALLAVIGLTYPALTAAMVRGHLFRGFEHAASGMAPTIREGDRVLATLRHASTPERGEVVVFHRPGRVGEYYTKRVVGLEGDRVAWRDGVLFVNGAAKTRESPTATGSAELEEVMEELGSRRYRVRRPPGGGETFEEIVVPAGHCFLLGDNRGNSRDSRHFDSVPVTSVVGSVDYLFLPVEDWSRFGVLR